MIFSLDDDDDIHISSGRRTMFAFLLPSSPEGVMF
jgi:hypothetical protein